MASSNAFLFDRALCDSDAKRRISRHWRIFSSHCTSNRTSSMGALQALSVQIRTCSLVPAHSRIMKMFSLGSCSGARAEHGVGHPANLRPWGPAFRLSRVVERAHVSAGNLDQSRRAN